jgi:DNA (cytosine-5)-methyltransferase 1
MGKGKSRSQKVAALFAGIAGIELGLRRAGHELHFLCENDPGASAVLTARFPQVRRHEDITDLDSLPSGTTMLSAGFPCQDLSQNGDSRGIHGKRSGLIKHVFRLIEHNPVQWLLLENVPFMLQLNGGEAIRYITRRLEKLGYKWAYRLIDTRAFGIPHRRERVYLVASHEEDPARLLFVRDTGPRKIESHPGVAYGFYWTEGNSGLGWAVDAIPTLKAGSTLGIPSPPAIWMPDGGIVTPDIRDAERLQGFKVDWTAPAERAVSRRYRWRLVGNAVTVDVAEWVGIRISSEPSAEPLPSVRFPFDSRGPWPRAAFGSSERRLGVRISSWPVGRRPKPLVDFLKYDPKPLSKRASSGFIARLKASRLNYPEEFMTDLEAHLKRMS